MSFLNKCKPNLKARILSLVMLVSVFSTGIGSISSYADEIASIKGKTSYEIGLGLCDVVKLSKNVILVKTDSSDKAADDFKVLSAVNYASKDGSIVFTYNDSTKKDLFNKLSGMGVEHVVFFGKEEPLPVKNVQISSVSTDGDLNKRVTGAFNSDTAVLIDNNSDFLKVSSFAFENQYPVYTKGSFPKSKKFKKVYSLKKFKDVDNLEVISSLDSRVSKRKHIYADKDNLSYALTSASFAHKLNADVKFISDMGEVIDREEGIILGDNLLKKPVNTVRVVSAIDSSEEDMVNNTASSLTQYLFDPATQGDILQQDMNVNDTVSSLKESEKRIAKSRAESLTKSDDYDMDYDNSKPSADELLNSTVDIRGYARDYYDSHKDEYSIADNIPDEPITKEESLASERTMKEIQKKHNMERSDKLKEAYTGDYVSDYVAPKKPKRRRSSNSNSSTGSNLVSTGVSPAFAGDDPSASRQRLDLSSYDTSDIDDSTIGGKVAKESFKYIGNPYVWGGNSLTNGIDCSGFTSQLYLKHGISLPRTSTAQRNAGTKIYKMADAKPGDLVCYPGHVAVYVGNGNIVHASSPRVGIIKSKVTYGMRPLFFVRVTDK